MANERIVPKKREMKKLIIFIVLSLSSNILWAQKPQDDLKSMFDSTVKFTYAFIKDAALRDNKKADFLNNIYLLDEQKEPLNYLSDSVNKLFKFIDIFDRKNKKLLSKGISAWEVKGELNNNVFLIRVVD